MQITRMRTAHDFKRRQRNGRAGQPRFIGHNLDGFAVERRAGQREAEGFAYPHRAAAGAPPAAQRVMFGDLLRADRWLGEDRQAED